MNRQWQLNRRPVGEPTISDFKLVTGNVPVRVAENDVLVRNRLLSLDPYMRWRMDDAKSYAPAVGLGEVMVGATISEVLQSPTPEFKVGDIVAAQGGWQDYAVVNRKAVRKLDVDQIAPEAYLGVLGSPGFTAYAGLMKIGNPRPGETVVVGAATGPVGSMVGQLARRTGARAVAIAGGAEKCGIATSEFGFSAAIDHRAPDFAAQLANACPDGIDVYFENIGGEVLEAVIPLLNDFARIPVCGVISQYSGLASGENETSLNRFMRDILVKRLLVRGFIVTDFADIREEFDQTIAPLVASGEIRRLEDVVEGLEQAPQAFLGLLRGKNRGKLIVRIDDD